jgi:hypothetical protein
VRPRFNMFASTTSAVGSGASKRPRFGRTGANGTSRAVQGDVTVNLAVNDAEPLRRRTLRNVYKDRPQELCGTLDFDGQIRVLRGDFVFVPNYGLKAVRSELPVEQRNVSISSFNGLPVYGARTQLEHQARYKFVGISKGAYVHADINQPENGLAVQHRGATSVPNNGTDEFFPGDLGIPAVPSPNVAEREDLLGKAGHVENTPVGRLHAIPKLLEYSQAVRVAEGVVHSLVKSANAARYSLRNLRPSVALDLDQFTRFGLAVKQSTMQTVWNGIAVLAEYGLIELKFPTISNIVDANRHDQNLLSRRVYDYLADASRRVTVDGANQAVNLAAPFPDADKRRHREQLLWLALKLDLIHDDRGLLKNIVPASALIDSLLITDWHSWLDPKDVLDVRRFLDHGALSSKLPAFEKVSRCTGGIYDISTFGEQLAKSQTDAKTNFYRTAMDTKHAVDSLVGFVALNHAKPREMLDVLV